MDLGRQRTSPRAPRAFAVSTVVVAAAVITLLLAALLPWPSGGTGAAAAGAGAGAPGAAAAPGAGGADAPGAGGGVGSAVAGGGAAGGDPVSMGSAANGATGPAMSSRIDAAPDGAVSVFVSPAGAGQLAVGADLSVTVHVVNRTDAAIDPGEVVLSMTPGTLDSRAEYGRWLAPPSTSPRDDLGTEVVRAPTPAVAAGGVAELAIAAAAGALPVDAGTTFGPRGIGVRLLLQGVEAAQDRSSTVVAGSVDALPTPLSVVVPIVPPDASVALLTTEDLDELTAPDGRLTALLDAVDGTRATLAIDPRILLSIRALGDDAPQSARAWLERLEELPNDSFALPYADADPNLQRQAGLEVPLTLDSLDFALGPEPVEPEPTEPEPSESEPSESEPSEPAPTDTEAPATETPGTDAPSTGDPTATTDTPSPTPQPDEAPARPTLDELTAFPYTIDALAWPSPNTIGAADLDALLRWGYRGVLVDGGSVERLDDTYYTPAAQVDLDGWSAVVADDQLTAALARAASPGASADLDAAIAELSTVLAIVARELPYEPRTMLATTGHAAADDPQALGVALRAIDALPWVDGAALQIPDLTADAPDAATLREGAHDPTVVARVHELFAAEQRADAIATMFDEPDTYRSQQRAVLLGMLSASWHERRGEWDAVSTSYVDGVTATDASVAIIESSEIQLVGRESHLPIFVNNTTDRAVTVQVSIEPTTGRLEAGDPVTLRIEPGSMARAQVPVKAISNGFATVDVRVLTPDGVPLLSTLVLRVNVQAEWETVGMIVLAAGLGVLFVAGIVRTVRRRRRERVVVPPGGGATGDEG